MTDRAPLRERAARLFQDIQSLICSALEEADGSAKFRNDRWDRTDTNGGEGGGGLTANWRQSSWRSWPVGGVAAGSAHCRGELSVCCGGCA